MKNVSIHLLEIIATGYPVSLKYLTWPFLFNFFFFVASIVPTGAAVIRHFLKRVNPTVDTAFNVFFFF